ncbi:MAG: methyltransferase domain-containing protein [Cyanobacteria bacterium J06648_1]
MFEQQPQSIQQKVKSMANNSADKDPSGWFEPLYADASGDTTQVPWAKNQAHPYLQQWLETYPPETAAKTALVIGCGLGDDAELLSELGYQVTAFDISPTAIAWCQQRFPDSQVDYQVADLFSLDPNWQGKFDFVFECRTIQALPLDVRSQVTSAIAPLVAKEGTLIVVTRHREENTIPEGPPWALSSAELGQFVKSGLTEVRRDRFIEGEQNKVEQLRLEYHLI